MFWLIASLISIVVIVIIVIAALFIHAWYRLKIRYSIYTEEYQSNLLFEGAIRVMLQKPPNNIEKIIPNFPDIEIEHDDIYDNDVKQIVTGKDDDATCVTKFGELGLVTPTIDDSIFRAYDIRGIAGDTLNNETVGLIANAIGSTAVEKGETTIIVGRDGRNSSPEITETLIKGLNSTGCNVIDIGLVPSPVLYYATHKLEINSAVMVTGSHNASRYNGFKIIMAGNTLAGEDIQELGYRAGTAQFTSGEGNIRQVDVKDDYIAQVKENMLGQKNDPDMTQTTDFLIIKPLKIVVDCGNGVAGIIAPTLFRQLGHEVIELFCAVDGNFPYHHPDPSQPDNLEHLIDRVKEEEADLGFAFDGDGDRLGVIDNQGKIIWPDRQLMLYVKDIMGQYPNEPVIFDVKCSRHLITTIEESGGKPVMWKTGHSLIKQKMKEINAPLAGEYSGHLFFKDRWYGFDDAFYAAARVLEIMTKTGSPIAALYKDFPESISTHELRIDIDEDNKEDFMETFRDELMEEVGDDDDMNAIELDGIRIEYPYGWGLLRCSNTSPFLTARFEADDEDGLEKIQSLFKKILLNIDAEMYLPF